MKVERIETIRFDAHPNLLWVQVTTDGGLVGLGEIFRGTAAAEGHIHQIIAPYLIGKDPCQIEAHQSKLIGYTGFVGSSAEMRGRSGIDMALWDIFGQSLGLSCVELWGGRVRPDIRAYNTCAGSHYVQSKPTQGTENFGLGRKGQFEDLDAFLNRPVELAHSLLEMGIDAMKIWPFDYAAEASAGQSISAGELKKALAPFEEIRAAFGDRIDLMAELHSLWCRPEAVKIARALEPIEPLWVEDPVVMDHLASIGEVARQTRSPIAVGETRGGRADYRYLMELEALSLLIMDMSWCGGPSEARKIASAAETYHLPVAFHDCTGPVALTICTHLALHCRNCFIQEMVRAFYFGWYGDLVTQLPPVDNGRITVPEGAGWGTALLPDRLARDDCHMKTSTAQSID